MPLPLFDQSPWPERLAKWACAWNLDGLESRVRFTASTRMRASLGRYLSKGREIRIASFLFDGPPALLEEVVCHELAHAAVDERFGRDCRPHGFEWRAMMARVGRDPRVRVPAAELEGLLPARRSAGASWRHRCPVCLAERVARRPVRAWRCARCVSKGLDGRIEIRRLDADESTGGGTR
jgi:predicted SprT family Zn-dependent metalloprotease